MNHVINKELHICYIKNIRYEKHGGLNKSGFANTIFQIMQKQVAKSGEGIMDTKRIGEFLIEKKVMNENQVNDVLKHCKKRGIRRFF